MTARANYHINTMSVSITLFERIRRDSPAGYKKYHHLSLKHFYFLSRSFQDDQKRKCFVRARSLFLATGIKSGFFKKALDTKCTNQFRCLPGRDQFGNRLP